MGLCACSHVNEMRRKANNTHTVPSHFILFFRSFPTAMQNCEICVWQGTCLCKSSAELVHPRSAALTMGKVHTGSLSFPLPPKYSRYTQRLWRRAMDLKPFPWRGCYWSVIILLSSPPKRTCALTSSSNQNILIFSSMLACLFPSVSIKRGWKKVQVS